MAKITLNNEQKIEIKLAEKAVKQIQLLKRIQSVKMAAKGMTNIDIAEILSVSDQTICNWLQVYQNEGLHDLLQWNYSGRISILTADNILKLKERNDHKPFEKASEAKDYIKKEFGIDYHLHWVQKLLKKNFNLHSKKPN